MIAIHISGPQGSGKTTTRDLIQKALESAGAKVLTHDQIRYEPRDASAKETRKALDSIVGITMKQLIAEDYYQYVILEICTS